MIVKVRAEVEFIYDLDEIEFIDTPEECVEDVRSMLANNELNSSDFTIGWDEEND
jgi:hypothetical protein